MALSKDADAARRQLARGANPGSPILASSQRPKWRVLENARAHLSRGFVEILLLGEIANGRQNCRRILLLPRDLFTPRKRIDSATVRQASGQNSWQRSVCGLSFTSDHVRLTSIRRLTI